MLVVDDTCGCPLSHEGAQCELPRLPACTLGLDVPALRAWDRTYRKPQESSGLLPVANVYGDARLWANTEWAAWLLLDKSDFAV